MKIRNMAWLVLAGAPSAALAQQPANWKETLETALRLNSRPRARDYDLEAKDDEVRAAKHSALPTLSLGAGVSAGSSSGHYSSQGTDGRYVSRSNGNSFSANAGLDLHWTVFNCGRTKYTIESAKISKKIMESMFEDYQSFRPNTKGWVVNNTFEAVSSFLFAREVTKFTPRVERQLERVKRVVLSNVVASSAAESSIQQLKSDLIEFRQSLEEAKRSFTHWVTRAPSDNFSDMETTIRQMVIPRSSREAFELAKENSPYVRQSVYSLQQAQLQLKIIESTLCPEISSVTSVGWRNGRSHYASDGAVASSHADSRDRGFEYSTGLFMRMPLIDLARRDRIAGQKKSLIAAKLDQEASLEDTQFNIETAYRKLNNYLELLAQQRAVVNQLAANLGRSEQEIENQINFPDLANDRDSLDWANTKSSEATSYFGAVVTLIQYQSRVLDMHFSIQQYTGALFGGGR